MKILHSFPTKEKKFKWFNDLTFSIKNIENFYVDKLKDYKYSINDLDLIVIHSLRKSEISFLNNNIITIPIIWFSWGGDFYNLLRIRNKILLPKTKWAYYNILFAQSKLQSLRIFIENLIGYSSYDQSKYFLKALSKLSYMVPVMPGDYDVLNNAYPSNLKMFHLNYVNPLFIDKSSQVLNGTNILLGNSATFSNNHFEAIDVLSKNILLQRKVVIPLSYGDKLLAKKVEKYANNKLGSKNVEVLVTFLNFNEYQKILNSCSIVFMNHVRQQAVRNIVQALLLGSHIYLNKKSVVYDFLKRKGFYLSSIDSSIKIEELTPKQKRTNNILANQVFGVKQQHNSLRVLLEKFEKQNVK